MLSVLDQIRDMSIVVADTGDLEAVRRLRPVDCTTNPTLVLRAMDDADARSIVDREIAEDVRAGLAPAGIADRLTVALGAELAGLVPGRVSTEVEARLSFDTEASVRRARRIIEDYAARGIGRDRVLIKLAATWEGIRAAEMLQREGIDCDLTLVFTLAQPVAGTDAGAFLISPFWAASRIGTRPAARGPMTARIRGGLSSRHLRSLQIQRRRNGRDGRLVPHDGPGARACGVRQADGFTGPSGRAGAGGHDA
jgi:transaldolase